MSYSGLKSTTALTFNTTTSIGAFGTNAVTTGKI